VTWIRAEWLTWSETIAHVDKVVGSFVLRVAELEPRLLAGQIRAVDRCVGPGGKVLEINLTGKFFRDAQYSRGMGRIVSSDVWDRQQKKGVWHHNVFLLRADVFKWWPAPDQPERFDRPEGFPRKDRRGVKADFDWEKILIAGAALLARDGCGGSQEEFINAIYEKFSQNWKEGGPSPTQMKAHLGPLYFAMREALKP
jgi:hypothetical protein